MKKMIASLATVLFLSVVAGPLLASTPTPNSTPAGKTMKHKKTHHKKMSKNKKGPMASSTPAAK